MRTVTNIINHEMHRIVHKQGRDFVRQGYFEKARIITSAYIHSL